MQSRLDAIADQRRWADAPLGEIVAAAVEELVTVTEARRALIKAFMFRATQDVQIRDDAVEEAGGRCGATDREPYREDPTAIQRRLGVGRIAWASACTAHAEELVRCRVPDCRGEGRRSTRAGG